MNSPTASKTVVVVNEQGVHLRPADLIARLAGQYDSRIELVKDSVRVDAKSILEIVTLVALKGTVLTIEATGHDAREAVDALAELIHSGFPEKENPRKKIADCP